MRPSSSPSDQPADRQPTNRAGPEPPGLFDEVLARGGVRSATDDRAWLEALLDAEAALALARADVGLTTAERAGRVAAACRADRFEIAQLARDAAPGGNPVIPLVRALTAVVADDDGGADCDSGGTDEAGRGAAEEVHRGATSQDILDTAAMLVVARSAEPLLDDLGRAATAAARLARTHQRTPMAGRTLLQQATPTTFGLKAAGWLVALDDADDRLVRLRNERLAVQLGGATGTLSDFDGRGVEVVERFAARLGLQAPVLAWHTDRSRVAEVAGGLAIAAGVVGKVALDVVLLAQTEVGEVREGVPGRGGSSAMPHKANPVAAVLARAAAAQAPGLQATLLAAMAQEHERAAGAWHAEWRPLIELLRAAGSAAAWLADCLSHLEIDAERMAHNLRSNDDVWAAEGLAAALAPKLGSRSAHDLVADLSRRASAEGRPLGSVVADDPRTGQALGPEGLAALLDPSQDQDRDPPIGEAAALVERALVGHARRSRSRPGRAEPTLRAGEA